MRAFKRRVRVKVSHQHPDEPRIDFLDNLKSFD